VALNFRGHRSGHQIFTGLQSGELNELNKTMLCSKIVRSVSSFLLTSLFIAGFFSIIPASAQTSGADPIKAGNYGLSETATKIPAFESQSQGNATTFLNSKIGSIVGVVLSFVGVIFLILMIYAGLVWMTAQGNQEQVNKAKDLMINAIIGLIIVLAAYAITAFIGARLIKG